MRDEAVMLDLLREIAKQLKALNEKICCLEDQLTVIAANTDPGS